MQNNQLNGITVIQSDAFNAREIIDMTPCLVIGKSRSCIYLHFQQYAQLLGNAIAVMSYTLHKLYSCGIINDLPSNLGYIPSNELDAKPCFITSIELNTPFFNQQLNIV